jgi:membrane protein
MAETSPSPPRRAEPRITEERAPTVRRRLREILRRLEAHASVGERKRFRVAFYLLRLAGQVIRQWARDRCPQQAASLAFQTVLSIVPAMAVGLSALRATGNTESESSLIGFLSDRLLPFSRDQIADKLEVWSHNVTFESLGLVGLITTVILAFVMWSSLEKILNHIWRVERKRSFAQKFVVFYATATIGPFLMAISIYQASRIGLTSGFVGYFVSFTTTFVALFLANFFLPAAPVRVVPAAVGSLLTAVLFEIAKYGFSLYVASYASQKYAGIYGVVAVVPLALIWIYWSWLMLLLGAEVAHAWQNIHWLERIERRTQLNVENELLRRVNGTVAARLMVAIAAAYIRGDKVTSRRWLADRFDLSDEVVDQITDRLAQADLVIEAGGDQVGLVPARPPAEITLADVLTVFRSEDVDDEATPGRSEDPIDKILREIDRTARERTRGLSLAELVPPPDTSR